MKLRSKFMLTGIVFSMLVSMSLFANSEVHAAETDAAAEKRPVKFDVYSYETSKLVDEPKITIDNPWGDVRFRTHRKPNIKVQGTLQRIGADAPEPTFKPEETEQAFKFSVDIPKGILEPRSNRVDLVVYVPNKADVTIKTRDGSIEAKKTINTVTAESETGNITITNHGSVHAKSAKGKVQVQPMYAGWGEIKIDSGEGEAIAFLPDTENMSIEVNGATELNTEFELEGELPGPLKLVRGLGNDKYTIQAAGPVKVFKTVKPNRGRGGSMYGTIRMEMAEQAEKAREAAAKEKAEQEKKEDAEDN